MWTVSTSRKQIFLAIFILNSFFAVSGLKCYQCTASEPFVEELGQLFPADLPFNQECANDSPLEENIVEITTTETSSQGHVFSDRVKQQIIDFLLHNQTIRNPPKSVPKSISKRDVGLNAVPNVCGKIKVTAELPTDEGLVTLVIFARMAIPGNDADLNKPTESRCKVKLEELPTNFLPGLQGLITALAKEYDLCICNDVDGCNAGKFGGDEEVGETTSTEGQDPGQGSTEANAESTLDDGQRSTETAVETTLAEGQKSTEAAVETTQAEGQRSSADPIDSDTSTAEPEAPSTTCDQAKCTGSTMSIFHVGLTFALSTAILYFGF